MAARQRKTQQAVKSSSNGIDQRKTEEMNNEKNEAKNAASTAQLAEEHLPPLLLVFVVMACSGLLWVFALRDFLSTGRVIAGSWDEAMQLFTKSTVFFSDEKGWKSQAGGLSSIQQVTTDANNMGGLFLRKVGGAAVLAVQSQKLIPLLFHPLGAMWNMGHFRPILITAVVSNLCVALFYASYMEDFSAANADALPKLFIGALALESLVMLYYLATQKKCGTKESVVVMPAGKTPRSVTNRIVTRTIMIVSGFRAVIAVRDLFFPGRIIEIIPRDDIYLEWTGAFLHSPPEGSEEAEEGSMTSPLYIGDKFLSQLMALNILILCLYKFASALFIRFGQDGSGTIKCKMIWRVQALSDAMITFLFRLFAPAAMSASLDLRWHLMAFAYETFILGLYAYF